MTEVEKLTCDYAKDIFDKEFENINLDLEVGKVHDKETLKTSWGNKIKSNPDDAIEFLITTLLLGMKDGFDKNVFINCGEEDDFDVFQVDKKYIKLYWNRKKEVWELSFAKRKERITYYFE